MTQQEDRAVPGQRDNGGACVADVMTSEVVSVGLQATYSEIVGAMLAHDVSGLPVLGADGALLGMVTETDLIAKEAYRGRSPRGLWLDRLRGRDTSWVAKARGRVAADLMSTDVDTVAPDTDLYTVARLMLARRHQRLPVLAEGRVVGIVARHDLLRPFKRCDTDLVADVEAVLAGGAGVPSDLDVHVDVDSGVVQLWGSTKVPGDIPVVITAVARVPGVIAVDAQLFARDPNPTGRL